MAQQIELLAGQEKEDSFREEGRICIAGDLLLAVFREDVQLGVQLGGRLGRRIMITLDELLQSLKLSETTMGCGEGLLFRLGLHRAGKLECLLLKSIQILPRTAFRRGLVCEKLL